MGFVTNDTYVYDDANRLTCVNAVNYTWDNNGNLLNDGVNTYTYDSANRLKSMSNQSTVTSYQYNGLNDRLQETVNGSTTTFTMDLNAGLTQALSDGTKAYIYGNGRIAQATGTSTEYFLGDALGSVRQMTNPGSTITYAKAYDPYGVVTSASGASQTAYGYTSEYTSQGLVYLRSRYYTPGTGRFLTLDTWNGNATSPTSYNAWLYVYANPIDLTDPSGHDPWWCAGRPDEKLCYAQWRVDHGGKLTADDLRAIYNIFPDETLKLLQQEFGINIPPGYQFRFAFHTSTVFNGPGWFDGPPWATVFGVGFWFAELDAIEGTIFELSSGGCGLYSTNTPSQATHIDYSVYITDAAFTNYKFNPDDVAGTMIHEAVHAWQESIVRDNLSVFIATFSVDVRTDAAWFTSYSNGMERQAIDITRTVNDIGTIKLSQIYLDDTYNYKSQFLGGPDFPVDIPVYGLIIR